LYREKLKPLEVTYRFNDFVSPLLVSVCAYILYHLLLLNLSTLIILRNLIVYSLCLGYKSSVIIAS
jgi:hypothetical protein